jgi:hypothetical protein
MPLQVALGCCAEEIHESMLDYGMSAKTGPECVWKVFSKALQTIWCEVLATWTALAFLECNMVLFSSTHNQMNNLMSTSQHVAPSCTCHAHSLMGQLM